MTMTVRPLESKDEASWRELWAGYLSFYDVSDLDPKTTTHTWGMLTGPREDVFGWIAELDGLAVGYVHCVLHANTWSTKPVCYLEDLYVDASARGQGAGEALIKAVTTRQNADNWHKVYWRTGEDNLTAQSLYNKLAKRIEFLTYEVDPL